MPAAGLSLSNTRDRFATALTSALDPSSMGFTVRSVRAEGLAASRGSTDFAEYFVYFSFFLVASALVLAALFFRLSVEQRAREVGLLRAVGFSTPRVRRLFAAEGLLLALIGSILGIGGAIAYGAAMMAGLRTWWSGAVGTTALTLHVSPVSLLAGAAGAVLAAMACIWWTLRSLSRISDPSLLAGTNTSDAILPLGNGGLPRRSAAGAKAGGLLFTLAGLGLIAAAIAKAIEPAGAFFGAGAAILIACLCLLTWRLRATAGHSLLPAVASAKAGPVVGWDRWTPIARLGCATRPNGLGRSVRHAVIASATFILISVDAFRRGDIDATDRHSGTGGYPLMVDLLLPIVHDPNTRDGREALGIGALTNVAVEPFRVLPGDDASCLNLYEPTNPRIIGASQRFIDAGRFSFQDSLASSDEDRANPWLLLARPLAGNVIPVAADANSLTYVLHKKLVRRSSWRTAPSRHVCASSPRSRTACSRVNC
jgi:hypothetical protein